MLSDVSGSRKSKMAVVKPEMYRRLNEEVSQLVDIIQSKFQRQLYVFEDAQLNVTKLRYLYFRCNGRHLGFPIPLTSANILLSDSDTELGILKNMVVTVGISIITCLQADIHVFPI